VAGLVALLAFVVLRRGGCTAVPSSPPPGAPGFASGTTGLMVTCAGGPELLAVVRAIVFVTAALACLLLTVVVAQAITGRQLLPWHVPGARRPRLFALGAGVAAVAVGLTALGALSLPTPAPVMLLLNPMLLIGIAIMWYARASPGLGRPASGP
jgi:hypothetical protein